MATATCIIIAWASFWLNPKLYPTARMLVILLAFMGLSFVTGLMRIEVPTVSYNTYYDMYMGTCCSLIFIAFIEFIIVARRAGRRGANNGNNRSRRQSDNEQIGHEMVSGVERTKEEGR